MPLPIGLEAIAVSILNGTALSADVPLGAKTLVGIVMPAAWTAASLTFQATADGGNTYGELQDGAGAAVTFTVGPGVFVQVDPAKWRGVNEIKVRSGTSGAPVNQGADRTILLMVRPLA